VVCVDPPQIPDGLAPTTLAKSSLRRLLLCSDYAEAPPEISHALMKGRLLDRLVAAHLAGGLPPDPLDGVVEMLTVDGGTEATETLLWINELSRLDRHNVADEVLRLNETVIAAWGEPRDSWWARTEVPLAWRHGPLTLHGRADVVVGDPQSAPVLIEVKSGKFWHDHLADLRFYALVAALRGPVSPRAIVWFHPANDSPWMIEPVTDALLESEARRVEGALQRIGSPRSAGWWCTRCRHQSDCPVAASVVRGEQWPDDVEPLDEPEAFDDE
jgi:PD-(D/E)XK nuclease superfamily